MLSVYDAENLTLDQECTCKRSLIANWFIKTPDAVVSISPEGGEEHRVSCKVVSPASQTDLSGAGGHSDGLGMFIR